MGDDAVNTVYSYQRLRDKQTSLFSSLFILRTNFRVSNFNFDFDFSLAFDSIPLGFLISHFLSAPRSTMASNRESNVQEESSPLLSSHQQFEEPQKEAEKPAKAAPATQPDEKSPVQMGQVNGGGNGCGWTADGLPLTHGSVVGEPMGRNPWDSDLLACLGRNDEFCSSDLEVCKFSFLF